MFLEHYQKWCLLSYGYLHDLDDAKDVVQTIFIKLLQIKEHKAIDNLKSYINTAIRNESLKKLKASKEHSPYPTPLPMSPSYENECIGTGKLKIAQGENRNKFFTCSKVADSIISENSSIEELILPKTSLYDIDTEKGKIYTFSLKK